MLVHRPAAGPGLASFFSGSLSFRPVQTMQSQSQIVVRSSGGVLTWMTIYKKKKLKCRSA
jgi:hypothetical protein